MEGSKALEERVGVGLRDDGVPGHPKQGPGQVGYAVGCARGGLTLGFSCKGLCSFKAAIAAGQYLTLGHNLTPVALVCCNPLLGSAGGTHRGCPVSWPIWSTTHERGRDSVASAGAAARPVR